jgi:hypothetical protein
MLNAALTGIEQIRNRKCIATFSCASLKEARSIPGLGLLVVAARAQ